MLALQILGGIVGASLASAVQCLAERYLSSPHWLREWTFGRSICDGCGKPLSKIALLPIFGFVLGRGRARCCSTRLSPLYLFLELIGAVLGVLVVTLLALGETVPALLALLVGLSGVFLFTTDYKALHLPVPLLVLTLTLALGLTRSIPSLVGAGVGIGVIGVLYLATRGRGMGSGDVLLAGILGATVAFPLVVPNLVVAFIAGGIVGGGLLLTGRAKKSEPIPFGVFLIPLIWLYFLVPHGLDWLLAVYRLS